MRRCARCDAGMNDADAFCMACGTKQPTPDSAGNRGDGGIQATSLACPQCGGTVGTGMRFCMFCGSPVPEPLRSVTGMPDDVGTSAGHAEGTARDDGAPASLVASDVDEAAVITPPAADASPDAAGADRTAWRDEADGSLTAEDVAGVAPTLVSAVVQSSVSADAPGVAADEDGVWGAVADAPQVRASGRGKRWIAAIVGLLLLVLVAVAVWWFAFGGNHRGSQDHSTASDMESSDMRPLHDRSDHGSSQGQAKDDGTGDEEKGTACEAVTDASLSDVRQDGDALVAHMRLSADCEGEKPIFDQSDVTVSLRDGDGIVVAAAVFDFSRHPVAFAGGDAEIALSYGPWQRWRPVDQIDTDDMRVVWRGGKRATSSAHVAERWSGAVGGDDIDAGTAENYAQSALTWQLDHDASGVQALRGHSTTQLSSKNYGMNANGKVWKYRDIYEQFLELRARHSQAVLLWGADYTYYTSNGRAADYYVTLSGETFASKDDATVWCPANGYSAGDCLAMTFE